MTDTANKPTLLENTVPSVNEPATGQDLPCGPWIVKKIFNNGYRCCCKHLTEVKLKYNTEEEALAQVPLVNEPIVHRDQYDFYDSYDLEEITVLDPARQVIAYAVLQYPAFRVYRYNTQQWKGYVDDKEFEELQGTLPGETWEEACARIEKAVIK